MVDQEHMPIHLGIHTNSSINKVEGGIEEEGTGDPVEIVVEGITEEDRIMAGEDIIKVGEDRTVEGEDRIKVGVGRIKVGDNRIRNLGDKINGMVIHSTGITQMMATSTHPC